MDRKEESERHTMKNWMRYNALHRVWWKKDWQKVNLYYLVIKIKNSPQKPPTESPKNATLSLWEKSQRTKIIVNYDILKEAFAMLMRLKLWKYNIKKQFKKMQVNFFYYCYLYYTFYNFSMVWTSGSDPKVEPFWMWKIPMRIIIFSAIFGWNMYFSSIGGEWNVGVPMWPIRAEDNTGFQWGTTL